MVERRKKALITGGIVLLAVMIAYIFRLMGGGSFYPTLFSYLRSFVSIGIVRRLGAFCASAHCPKPDTAVSYRRCAAADFVVYLSIGKIFYLLAADCNKIPVVSFLFANAVCSHARTADCNVSG